jgi:CHAT domain-containing protein/Tfp pilus assembly protein PilF
MMGGLRLACAIAASLAAAAASCPSPQRRAEPEFGLIVESVEKNGLAYEAGLREGDRLLSWAATSCEGRPAAGGARLVSPLELSPVETVEAARCPVTLSGMRDDVSVSFTLGDGAWGLRTRPALGERLRFLFEHAGRALSTRRVEVALGAEKRLGEALNAAGRTREACWATLRLAEDAAKAGRPSEASAAFETARALARTIGGASLEARVWRREAIVHWDADDYKQATACYETSVRKQEEGGDDVLSRAIALADVGLLHLEAGDLDRAELELNEALAVQQQQTPEAINLVRTLNSLGRVAQGRGHLDMADEVFGRALAIAERRGSAGLDDASDILNNLSLVARSRGDLALAQTLLERSLRIVEARDPDSAFYALSLDNLALLVADRGDIERSEALHREALAILERRPAQGIALAGCLDDLGCLERDRGDLDAAEDLVRRSLAMRERLEPGSVELANSYSSLGTIFALKGEAAQAGECHRKALAIRQRLAPAGQDVAASLRALAQLAHDGGDAGGAERLLSQALEIDRRIAPRARDTADTLEQLGEIALEGGMLERAEALQREALAIRMRLMPGSAPLARSWHALARVFRKAGRGEEAATAMENALAALESQQGRLGGAQDVRAGFAAGYAHLYRDAEELALERHRPGDAFQLVERSRARSMLALLAERDIVFADVPAPLARERRRQDAAYDRTQAEIAALDPAKDGQTLETLLRRLRELRDQRATLQARVRAASPRLASLQYPRALGVEGARAALDLGTVLLSYSVGRASTSLFVLGAAPEPLEAFELPLGEQELRRRIVAFRGLIEEGRPDAVPSAQLREAGASLYDALLRPAAKALAGARRLLVSPDGPLHLLPFAALLTSRAPFRYLVEDVPVHASVSVTLYAELRKARRSAPASSLALAAFGDPTLPPRPAQPPRDTEDITLRSARLGPLPWSRDEVHRIARQFAPAAAEYLGAEATEERAKALGTGPRYLHFATHGVIDRRFPLNSALLLASPAATGGEGENGLLQAWEIFESMRLDADLVTLSACETGLGREAGGEGLISLSRAFHYAGARSVLSSLWSVSDRSTPELMVRFYAGLRQGQTKDQALQAAQIDMIRSAATAHPFHWAAFQLSGDWR